MPRRVARIHYGRCCGWAKLPDAKVTEDPGESTCPKCKKRILAWNLRPRWDYPGDDQMPVLRGYWVSRERYKRIGDKHRSRVCYLVFVCPCCGKENWHGGPGLKRSHCNCWSSYVVEAPKEIESGKCLPNPRFVRIATTVRPSGVPRSSSRGGATTAILR